MRATATDTRRRRRLVPLAATLALCGVIAAPVPTAGAAAAPGAADPAETARRTGVPVEIVSERTETARVFANPSGTRSLEQYVLPVRARRDGGWAPIDTRLYRNPDGSVAPGATVNGLRLSGGGAGPFVTIERNGASLALSWPGVLPAPVLDGDAATYPEVLPGVDLRVRVSAVGFSQVLVVKDATAAANPALRRLRFGTTARGLALRARADGGSNAVDAAGAAVFTSATPTMWDSGTGAPPPTATAAGTAKTGDAAKPAGTAKTGDAAKTADTAKTADPGPDASGRRRELRMEVGSGELAVVPDRAMLADPVTRYPVYIDPSYSAAEYAWTPVSGASSSKGTSYWTVPGYRDEARVGTTYGTGDGPWRSFFQVRIGPLARATISRAWFSISMIHTANCAESSVELWATKPIDPAVPLTWNNSAGNWLGGKALDTRSGKANKPACGQSPMLMEFGIDPDTVTPIVQEAANGAAGPQETLAFGLRIPSAHEGEQLYWKKFDEATARINVEYDTPPRAPTGLTTVPPTPCGTPAAPTPLNTTTPTFTGVGYDPNADNVTNDLEILSGESVLATVGSSTAGSGTPTRWPALPAGTLPANQPGTVFSYRSRTRDGTLTGPYGTRCYFTVDPTRPATPTVASADYPGSTPVRSVGETGTVTFTASSGDADVAGFRYGFTPDATTMWVAAGPGGSATVPVTLWPSTAGDTTDVSQTLYVRAIDRAGNSSALTPARALAAKGRAVTAPPVRADVNGDRRADVSAVVDQGDDRTAVWNLISNSQGGFHTGHIAWDTDVAGGFSTYRIASVTGDFDADGRTDTAIFREDPDQFLRLYVLHSTGSRYEAASAPVWTGSGLRVSNLKLVAGDFDNDGDDDIAEFQGLANGQTKLLVQLSDRGAFGAPVARWDSGAGGLSLDQANVVAGDFDADGDDDIADVRDDGNGQATLLVHVAQGGQFAAPVIRWTSGAGAFDARRARFAAGNTDGSGADEVVALYDDGAATAHLAVLSGAGGTWTSRTWWSSGAGAFDATRATLAAGDFDADGRVDVAALYDTGGGMRRLYTFASTGAAFADNRIGWEGYVSAAQPALHVDPNRLYLLQPVHSGKCVDVPGGSTADGVAIDQYDCTATAAWERFTFARVGSAPYFHVKTAAGKCLDVKSSSLLDNAPVVQWLCGSGGPPQPNQQFRLDLVGSSGAYQVVQLRDVHSDKCLQITGASLANNAALVQAACAASPPTNQQFLLRIEP